MGLVSIATSNHWYRTDVKIVMSLKNVFLPRKSGATPLRITTGRESCVSFILLPNSFFCVCRRLKWSNILASLQHEYRILTIGLKSTEQITARSVSSIVMMNSKSRFSGTLQSLSKIIPLQNSSKKCKI